MGLFENAPLNSLNTELSRMAALVESQLSSSINAFDRRDLTTAKNIVATDQRVDEFDRDIEIQVMAMLSKQRLSETALREVMTIMKLAGELERVGDMAKNVAKRTLAISQDDRSAVTSGVTRMGRVCLRQFSDILDAYSGRNLVAARAVWGGDDEVDGLYNSVFREILLEMMRDPQQINTCTHLVFIAKNFERVGDHATNIAEAIHFLMTGEPLVEERPKSDETATTMVSPPLEVRS